MVLVIGVFSEMLIQDKEYHASIAANQHCRTIEVAIYPSAVFSSSNTVHSAIHFKLTDTSYAARKSEVNSVRLKLRNTTVSTDSLSKLFTSLLVDHLIPHWLGTPWSFDGHTSVPRSGEIACGYFVSTTLKDMGFNLNRYTFAQQLPVHEAKTLALGKPVLEINSNSIVERMAILRDSLSEGIYFIGFDQSHVGYIHKKGNELFVIHSNYIGSEGVVIERIEDSQVFSYYTRIYIADISRNADLMKKWVRGEVIEVITK